MMQADDEVIMFGQDTDCEISQSNQRRRRLSSLKKAKLVSLLPNVCLLILFYFCFYSILCGFYLLLLYGVTATSAGGKHTLLWTFFFLGLVFMIIVYVAMYVDSWQKMLENASYDVSQNGKDTSNSVVGSKSRGLLNDPPPPPSSGIAEVGNSEICEDSSQLDDIELNSK